MTEIDLSGLSELEAVNIIQLDPFFGQNSLRSLRTGQGLRHATIANCTVLNTLQGLHSSRLLHLELTHDPNLSLKDIERIVVNVPNIRFLNLCGTALDDNTVSLISQHARKLEVLRCGNSALHRPKVDLPELKALDMGRCWNLEHVEVLAPDLLTVVLTYSFITDTTLAALGKSCPRLKYVWLSNCSNLVDSRATEWYSLASSVSSSPSSLSSLSLLYPPLFSLLTHSLSPLPPLGCTLFL